MDKERPGFLPKQVETNMPKTTTKHTNGKGTGFSTKSPRAKRVTVPVRRGPVPQAHAKPDVFTPETFPVEWIEIIRERYFADGWTPYSLASASGVSDSQIIRFFRGERDIRFQTAERLCRCARAQSRRLRLRRRR